MSESPRVPSITDRSQLPVEDRHHFDAIAESRGSVRGPFTVLLNRPELAGRIGRLGAFVRYEGTLPAAVREAAILTTAAEWESAYIWSAHRPIAADAGVPTGVIEALLDGRPTPETPKTLTVAIRFVREAIRTHRVEDRTFDAAESRHGTSGVIELVATAGYYGMMAVVNNTLRVLPDDATPFE